jgi:hypothetical protein
MLAETSEQNNTQNINKITPTNHEGCHHPAAAMVSHSRRRGIQLVIEPLVVVSTRGGGMKGCDAIPLQLVAEAIVGAGWFKFYLAST